MIVLSEHVAQDVWVEFRLRRLEREVSRGAVVELAEERVAGGPVVNDVCVAEARVDDRVALDPVQRAVDRLDGVHARRLGTRLEVRLVDLDDVGSRRLEVAQFLVDGFCVGNRDTALVGVVVVLSPAASS